MRLNDQICRDSSFSKFSISEEVINYIFLNGHGMLRNGLMEQKPSIK